MDSDAVLILTVMVTSTAVTLAALFVFQDVLMLAEDTVSSHSGYNSASDSSHATAAAAQTMNIQTIDEAEAGEDMFLFEDDDSNEEDGDTMGIEEDDTVGNIANAFIGVDGNGTITNEFNPNVAGEAGATSTSEAIIVTTTVFQAGENVFQQTETVGESFLSSEQDNASSRTSSANEHSSSSTIASLLPQPATTTLSTPAPAQRPPAPLIRRDSTQSEDHNMTCLHFYSITNRPASDFSKVLTQTDPRLLNVNSRVRYLHLSALHFAAMNASPDVLAELHLHGANIDAQDALGKTPLRHAMMLRRYDVISYLLSIGARDRPDIYGCSALRYALIKCHVDSVSTYLRQRPEALNGIMEGGAVDKNDPGHRPMHVAANSGCVEMMDMLMEFGGDVEGRDRLGRTPLMYAAIQGHEGIARILMGMEEEEEEKKVEPVFLKGMVKIEEGCERLLGKKGLAFLFNTVKADVNATDSHGWTALHYAAACTKENAEANIRFLVSSGANINATAIRYHLTPLHIAAKSGLIGPVSTFLNLGADPNIVTTDFRSPLHFAAQSGHVECVKLLLSHNASLVYDKVTFDDEDGMIKLSPLHLAIKGPKKEAEQIVRILVQNGVDVTASVPIQVEGWISWGLLCGWRKNAATNSKSRKNAKKDPITGIERETSIVHVSPISFALAAGQLDIAKFLLCHRPNGGWFWNMGLSQFLLCMAVVMGAKRWDIVWRLVVKTPTGILAALITFLVVFVRIAIFTTPPVTQTLMKDAWDICLKRRDCRLSCSQGLFRRECCVSPGTPISGFFTEESLHEVAQKICWVGEWWEWKKVSST